MGKSSGRRHDHLSETGKAKHFTGVEPGGQFDTLHQTCADVNSPLYQVKAVAEEMGIGFLGIGFQPNWRLEDIPIMPKIRLLGSTWNCSVLLVVCVRFCYDVSGSKLLTLCVLCREDTNIMRNYMPQVGTLGLDMMLRTCTVQANLDFSSEADMIRKFRAGHHALQPIATALFANSPFTEGKPNGFLSMRSHIWTDTDKDRTGMLPFVFDDYFGMLEWMHYQMLAM